MRDSALYAVVVCVALGLGVFLHWPSLDSGLHGDDFAQSAMLRGEWAAERSPFDVFNFASGDPRDVAKLADFGYLAWWTVPDLRLRMWRPLASGLMALDRRVLALTPPQQHWHSLGWYALLVVAASRLFRRWLSLPAAAIATVLFAIEEGHVVPLGWLANRSTLVATSLGLLTLVLHAGTREDAGLSRARRHWRYAATALCAGLSLLAGEYAFTALAYVFAYEALHSDPIALRIRRSLAVLLPTAVYLVLHTAVGSDIVGSGYYLSPLREPIAYAEAAVLRVPALFGDLSVGIPSDWFNGIGPFRNWFLMRNWFAPATWRLFPGWPYWHAASGYLAFALVLVLLRMCVRRAPEASRRPLKVMVLGTVLALVPAAGSLPGDRLIVAGAFGIAGLYGALLVHVRPRLRDRRPVLVATALVWLGVFVIAGPLTFDRTYEQAGGFAWDSAGQRAWADAAEFPSDELTPTKRVYVLATADFTTAANLPWHRLGAGYPLPKSYRRLSPAVAPHDITRIDDRTLQFMVLSSDLWYAAVPSLYRGANRPIVEGQRFRLPGLDIHVVQARDANPAIMHFTFDRSVDDPQLWFLNAGIDGLERFVPPKIGETIRVPRPIYRNLHFPLPPP